MPEKVIANYSGYQSIDRLKVYKRPSLDMENAARDKIADPTKDISCKSWRRSHHLRLRILFARVYEDLVKSAQAIQKVFGITFLCMIDHHLLVTYA